MTTGSITGETIHPKRIFRRCADVQFVDLRRRVAGDTIARPRNCQALFTTHGWPGWPLPPRINARGPQLKKEARPKKIDHDKERVHLMIVV